MPASSTESLLPPDPSTLAPSQLIALYHTLQKQLAAVAHDPRFPTSPLRQARRRTLRAHLALIGLPAYQAASTRGEARNGGVDASSWILDQLARFVQGGKRALLDVGAIRHRFPERWAGGELEVTSIDLNPEEEGGRVLQADFFEFARDQGRVQGSFDVVCLSLCVNFEGSAKRRGVMLYLAARVLKEGGVVFVVLPRACVENSRYCDWGGVREVLEGVGLEVVEESKTARLARWVGRKRGDVGKRVGVGKSVVRGGGTRNNFAIVLEWGAVEAEMRGEAEGEVTRGAVTRGAVTGGGLSSEEQVVDNEEQRQVDEDKAEEVEEKWRAMTRKNKGKRRKGKTKSAAVQKAMSSNQRKRARRQAMRQQKAGGGTGRRVRVLNARKR